MGQSIEQFLSFFHRHDNSSQAQAAIARRRDKGWKGGRIQGLCIALLSLVLVYISISPGKVWAATITAASCSYTDVETAVGNAANGDTVLIPAGTCTWTTTLFIIGKYFTLQGAGVGNTIITDGVGKNTFNSSVIFWDTIDGGLTRLTGFTFKGGPTGGPNSGKGIVEIQGQSHQFRLDHNSFFTTWDHATTWSGGVLGVSDHNLFDLSGNKQNFFAEQWNHNTWNQPSTQYGDVSWSMPDTVGTQQALFFENNTYRQDQTCTMITPCFYLYATDGYAGSRTVHRYNRFEAVLWSQHGTESGGRNRGARQYEVYNNTWTAPDGVSPWNMMGQAISTTIGSRGGVGVVFNNVVNTTNGQLGRVTDATNYRDVSPYSPWGQCNGTSAWDQNQPKMNGYRCLDQTGSGYGDLLTGDDNPIDVVTGLAAWPNQVVQPSYAWNNRLNGVDDAPVSTSKTLPPHIVIGRDFIHGPRPGYKPYPYPHPLVSGSTAPPPPLLLKASLLDDQAIRLILSMTLYFETLPAGLKAKKKEEASSKRRFLPLG